MRLARFALATLLLPLAISAAHADRFESGGVQLPTVTTTVVAPTNVVAGIGNTGAQNVGNIANGIKVKVGRGGSVDTTVVVPTNVVAGIGNVGAQNVGGIANLPKRR
jgi:hypothetical protein